VPAVIEKVIIPILILIGIAVSIYNPMNFEFVSRIVFGSAVVGLLTLLAFWLNRQGQYALRVGPSVPPSLGAANRAVVPPLDAPLVPPAPAETDIGPILVGLGSHTTAQMQARLAPYRGKRISFSGVVIDVRPQKSGSQVQFRADKSSGSCFLSFGKEWDGYLNILAKKARLKVSGIFDDIGSYGIRFKDCAIIP
jgi:hypothetical protein